MNYGRNTRLLKYWLITAFKNAAAPLISIESESSEIEIVQQERVILFIITLMKDYLGLTVQYFHFLCNYILCRVFVNERYKSIYLLGTT